MISETILGRYANSNLIDGLNKVCKEGKVSTLWGLLGWFSLLLLLFLLAIYSVISSWVIFYFEESLFGLPKDLKNIELLWFKLLADYKTQIILLIIFIVLTMLTLSKGVRKGLEQLNFILMPILFLILLFFVIYSALFIETFWKTIEFVFTFEFQKIDNKVVIAALSQSCFSLSTGAGAMFIYGSYLKKSISIIKSSFYVAMIQSIVSLLALFIIFPIIFYKVLPLDKLTASIHLNGFQGKWEAFYDEVQKLCCSLTRSVSISLGHSPLRLWTSGFKMLHRHSWRYVN